ncbi:beta-glucosidase A [mine drainage metagenome]|uniref:beta-glucosidase n=1 Tax=mine drainage metagenome TaxID=410659 RepID=A0A1J5T4M2_9ZZZZ
MRFPDNFAWGAATAAYQIEGAVAEDGRGPSVWDDFSARPGKVFEGHTGAVACDHYHRSLEDVALMREIGLNAYRFSIAWPRVMPDGTRAVNAAGLDFYDRLVDALLDAGIAPWVTLFHWDTPLALHRRGGWMNRDMVDWFADYTEVVARRLGDRVGHWMTLNEPQCFIAFGLGDGVHAPGDKTSNANVLAAWHNALLAHGRGVQVLRSRCTKPPRIGFAPTASQRIPASHAPEDVEAARRAHFEGVAQHGLWTPSMSMDPVYLGRYPEQGYQVYGADMPRVRDGDMELISQPLDFVGLNCYTGSVVRALPGGGSETLKHPAGQPVSMLPWLNLMEDALYWAARFFHDRYPGRPVVITENGFASTDWVALDGGVHDPARIDYTARYLRGLRRASAEGVPVAGYFHWSLLDNFEWAEGYRARFGLVHVDYATQRRTPKDSARWYAEVIRTNGGCLPD